MIQSIISYWERCFNNRCRDSMDGWVLFQHPDKSICSWWRLTEDCSTPINKILHSISFPFFEAHCILSAFLIKMEDEIKLFNRLITNYWLLKKREKNKSAFPMFNDWSLLKRARWTYCSSFKTCSMFFFFQVFQLLSPCPWNLNYQIMDNSY